MNASEIVAGVARRFRHGIAPALLALALVGTAIALTACAGSPFNKSASNHACADTVATAITSGQTTPGTWQCLDPKFQQLLNTYGYPQDDSVFAYQGSKVTSVTYLGSHGDMVTYDTVVTTSGKTESLVLVIWIATDGKVTNLNVAGPGF